MVGRSRLRPTTRRRQKALSGFSNTRNEVDHWQGMSARDEYQLRWELGWIGSHGQLNRIGRSRPSSSAASQRHPRHRHLRCAVERGDINNPAVNSFGAHRSGNVHVHNRWMSVLLSRERGCVFSICLLLNNLNLPGREQ